MDIRINSPVTYRALGPMFFFFFFSFFFFSSAVLVSGR